MAMLAALFAGLAHAAELAEAPFRYTVRTGDTLYTLASKYLSRTADYQIVQQLNKVANPRSIPPGTILLIPDALLKTEPVLGEIATFRGAVTVDGQQATVGTRVQQGSRVETGANAFVTIRLPDASAISMPSQSRIRVHRLRRVLLTGGLDRDFVLEIGRSQSIVTPITEPGSTFRVTTPLSVSAVRGTDFRVAFDSAGGRALTEVVGGTVGVARDEDTPATSVPKAFGIVATANGLDGPTALLPAPELAQMGRTATGVLITIKPVEGARSYRTQLASDAAFTDVFDEQVTDMPAASFTLSASTTFFVRLNAIAPSGLEGLPATYAVGRRIGEADPIAPVRIGPASALAAQTAPQEPWRQPL